MSKFEKAIETYKTFMTTKLSMNNVNEELLTSLATMLGDAIYDKDASIVACTDAGERGRVKQYFLLETLGLLDSPALEDAIMAVCKQMGTSNRKKQRVVFYYLLLENLQYTDLYWSKTAKTETAAIAAEARSLEVAEVAAPAAIVTNDVAEQPIEVATAIYDNYLRNTLGHADVHFNLLFEITKSFGEQYHFPNAPVIDLNDTEEREQIKRQFMLNRLGIYDGNVMDSALNHINDSIAHAGNSTYRVAYYYMITRLFHLDDAFLAPQPVGNVF